MHHLFCTFPHSNSLLVPVSTPNETAASFNIAKRYIYLSFSDLYEPAWVPACLLHRGGQSATAATQSLVGEGNILGHMTHIGLGHAARRRRRRRSRSVDDDG
jgi:hypothetical protein